MERNEVAKRLRPGVLGFLTSVEKQTGLTVAFKSLPKDHVVFAEYKFEAPDKATISLRHDWQDIDVAHEIMHMSIELVEGYSVLAWRRGVTSSDTIEEAFGLIRTYVDDEVVHARLSKEGYTLDGEVLRSNLFDHVYNKAAKKLNNLRPYEDDGMAHFDTIGYGLLRRSTFLVQAELIRKSYSKQLSYGHKTRLERFINAFRMLRKKETEHADEILKFFEDHDVASTEGHRHILSSWAQIERLDDYVGISSYYSQGNGYTLPYP